MSEAEEALRFPVRRVLSTYERVLEEPPVNRAVNLNRTLERLDALLRLVSAARHSASSLETTLGEVRVELDDPQALRVVVRLRNLVDRVRATRPSDAEAGIDMAMKADRALMADLEPPLSNEELDRAEAAEAWVDRWERPILTVERALLSLVATRTRR